MILTRPPHTLSDFIAHVPQGQIRQVYTHFVGVVQYGFVALAMFSVSAVAGGTGSVGLSVSRGGGFDGPVLLTAAGVPTGVTLTFGSSTVLPGSFSTSVNVSVAAGTAAATSAVMIVGTGGGLTSPAALLTLRTQ